MLPLELLGAGMLGTGFQVAGMLQPHAYNNYLLVL